MVGKPVVESVLSGYNGTIMAYGQTGTGKTFTLGSFIEKGIVWDSVYLVRFVQCGYEYEQSYAIFPLLSACIFILSQFLRRWFR